MSKPDRPDSNGKAKTGYKRPPVGSQFKRGQSGNPKGRTPGAPNFANLMQEAFNKPVAVKVEGKTVQMPSGEAIFRVIGNLAHQGHKGARNAYFKILEMTGRTADIADSERQQRRLLLPKSAPLDTWDLLLAPAREAERRRLIAAFDAAEAAGRAPQWGPKENDGGPDRNYDQHRRMQNPAWQPLDPEVASKGLEADTLCVAGDFAGALASAEAAIALSSEHDTTWLEVIRAHACMMLGRTKEAREFYLHFPNKGPWGTCWQNVILQDFSRLRAAGHSAPLIAEIERRLNELGWTPTRKPTTRTKMSSITSTEREFMVFHPDDVRTGLLLVRDGELDKASAVLRRCLATSRSKLARNKADAEARNAFDQAVSGLTELIRALLRERGYGRAMEVTQELLAAAPHALMVQLARAMTLMFCDEIASAQALFVAHRGKQLGEKSWETAVLEEFELYRKAGKTHPLMETVESLFARPISAPNVHVTLVPDSRLANSADVHDGRKLLEQGRPKEALGVFIRHLEGYAQRYSKEPPKRMRDVDDRELAVDAVCSLAIPLITNREFDQAKNAIEKALIAKPNDGRATICLAHILMLTGKADEAKTIYLGRKDQRLTPQLFGRDAILSDFAAIDKAGLHHALMDEIITATTESSQQTGNTSPAKQRIIR